MRPEYAAKSFGSPDVPHGTDSVLYKAAKVLKHEHKQAISLPMFTAEEITALKTSKEASLAISEVTVDAIGTGTFEIKEGDVVHASYTKQACQQEIDELMKVYLVDDMMQSREEKAEVREGDKTWKFATEADAFTAVLNKNKTVIAASLIDKAIDDCCIVPALSDEWKAQFVMTEVPQM